ncbi:MULTISPECIES: alpha/beta hydrolase [unclassified Burkholderia]|uniref:alpha/beta fold hydrolase n=1 Tax=unclassified Burkholderia TaxID=2613784 RepID=UPI0014233EB0|nr:MULTISPECIES: alpha/beta hydrolase [unclassified Burkholderia]NIE87634.1 alpha/beta hydrolase [Burkholderia sp. Tr-860]NIF66217.1 alpha/beta hydrolase [Burkholderia sp. Cy-647]NIF99081.1 alpha/beta hydrolase [Burkholderia sp. Ax-1720]
MTSPWNLARADVLIDGRRIATGHVGEGPPLVLVHGTPAHSIVWRNVIPACREAGFSVHWFDLLGFGESECPVDADTSVAEQARLLQRLLEHWSLDAVHLVGHDIGGVAALLYAMNAGERLRSLTIADAPGYDSWPSPPWREFRDDYQRFARVDAERHRELMTRQLKMAVHDKSRMTGELLACYLKPISGVIGQSGFYRNQVAHYDSRYTADFGERLPKLALPVQILWGAQDEWQPLDYAYRLQSDIPGAVLNVLDACGHFLMEDDPSGVARHIVDFANSHRPGS